MSAPFNQEKEIHIKEKEYEVYYMPYRGSLKDRLYFKYGEKFSLIRKALSFLELLRQNFTTKAVPFSNLHQKAEQLINKDDSIKKLIITGNPFVCFQFGYLLKRKFSAIEWIADYRDDWTTTELIQKRGILQNLLHFLDRKSEKKWVSSAKFITSVSKHYADKIGNFVGKKGYELLNGHSEEIKRTSDLASTPGQFTITYNGSLYKTQKIEPFLDVFKSLTDHYKNKLNLHINFPGLGFDKEQEQRVRLNLKNYEKHFTITNRIDREQVLQIQRDSNLLLMIAHENLKGVPSSKLYEYIGLGMPILLYPDDGDIIRKTLLDTGLGIICNSSREIENNLLKLIDEFIRTGKIDITGNPEKMQLYSAKEQVKNLAQLLDRLS